MDGNIKNPLVIRQQVGKTAGCRITRGFFVFSVPCSSGLRAQINGRDELPIPQKVELDVYYLTHRSFLLDLQIILKTVVKVVRAEGVDH